MTNKNIFTLIILLFSGLLCSCDPGTQIRYSVVNKTQSTLNLSVTPPSGVGLGAYYELTPNEELTIFSKHALGYASDIVEGAPMDSLFLNCLELTKDSMPLKININNPSAWTRENIGDTLAMYRLIIKSDLLK